MCVVGYKGVFLCFRKRGFIINEMDYFCISLISFKKNTICYHPMSVLIHLITNITVIWAISPVLEKKSTQLGLD